MPKKEEGPKELWTRYAGGILLGGCIALGLCLLLLLAASAAIYLGALKESHMDRITLAACVLGTFLGALWAVKRCARRALPVGAGTGAVVLLLLLLVGSLAFHAQPLKNGGVALALACLLGGCGAGLCSQLMTPRRKKRRK